MSSTHVTPVRTYAAILLALLVLTAVTVRVAFLDLGLWNDLVALGIATLKGTLVVLYFMHVRHSSRLVSLVWVGAIFLLIVLFGLTLVDYLTRGGLGVPESPL